MKYFLALFLLLATPAHAEECGPIGKIISALFSAGFVPAVEMAIDHSDVVAFVNEHHAYIMVEYRDDKTACIIGGGPMFYVLRDRKA